MANTEIQNLTPVVTLAGTDVFAVNQGGVSKYLTLDQIYAGVAGTLTKLGSQTVTTGIASVDFDGLMDGTYDVYLLTFSKMTVLGSADVYVRLGHSGGTYLTTGYYGHANHGLSNASTYNGQNMNNGAGQITHHATVGAGDSSSGLIWINRSDNVNQNTQVAHACSSDRLVTSSLTTCGHGSGTLDYRTNLIDSIQILQLANNIDGGVFTLYGVSN